MRITLMPLPLQPQKALETEMNILGLNAFHGDASAALLRDGQLVVGAGGGAAESGEALGRIARAGGESLSRGGATGSYRDLPESESSSGRQAVAGCAAPTSVGTSALAPRTARGLRRWSRP